MALVRTLPIPRARRGAVLAALMGAALLCAAGSGQAQLSNRDAPVVVAHYQLNATSIDEHRRFWIGTLGGRETDLGIDEFTAIAFPDAVVLLRMREPSGPTRGTTFDHIGFAVPDVPAMTAKAVAAGYRLTVGREPAPGETASPPTAGNYGRFSYLLGPDGVKVELVTNTDPDAPPIAHHHVHFVNRKFVGMQQWYMKVLNATLRPGQTDFFIGADLPGVGYMLNFFSWLPAQELTGTLGRAVERVGFDIRDLGAFTAELEKKGIAITTPYHVDPAFGGIGRATVVDPWGTVIELTEGFRTLLDGQQRPE